MGIWRRCCSSGYRDHLGNCYTTKYGSGVSRAWHGPQKTRTGPDCGCVLFSVPVSYWRNEKYRYFCANFSIYSLRNAEGVADWLIGRFRFIGSLFHRRELWRLTTAGLFLAGKYFDQSSANRTTSAASISAYFLLFYSPEYE